MQLANPVLRSSGSLNRQDKSDPDVAWKVDPSINGGGLFVDMQTHALDWLDHVFGPVQEDVIRGVFESRRVVYDAEDTVSYTLLFDEWWIVSPAESLLIRLAMKRSRLPFTALKGHVSMGFFRVEPCSIDSRGSEDQRSLIYPIPHTFTNP